MFSKNSDDYLTKGDRLFDAHRFYEARTLYEKGLEACRDMDGDAAGQETPALFAARITAANDSLAGLNIDEAEHAIRQGRHAKAAEHLELAQSLSNAPTVREKAERLLALLPENAAKPTPADAAAPEAAAGGGCTTCSSSSCNETGSDIPPDHPDMSREDYYDLLIRQLPEIMYKRYAQLGEKFVTLYLAASRDEHHTTLNMLEEWYQDQGSDGDIYSYEKGMILHRLGRINESEAWLRASIKQNRENPLPWLGLALLLVDTNRLGEAAGMLDHMSTQNLFREQAMMMRGEVSLMSGDSQGAIDRFAQLLTTPLARAAAEKLYAVLIQCGRQPEAAQVFKRYLGGCR
jgi:predicted negative regulator of RcsB-dependent stress response